MKDILIETFTKWPSFCAPPMAIDLRSKRSESKNAWDVFNLDTSNALLKKQSMRPHLCATSFPMLPYKM